MKQIDEKVVIERIKSLRKQYAGDRGRSKFARALGVSPSTYNYYETNRLPPIEILLKICELTGADLNWLLLGEKATNIPAETAQNPLLRKIEKLLNDNPDMFGAVCSFIDLLLEKEGIEQIRRQPAGNKKESVTAAKAQPQDAGWIPVLGRTAAGLVHFWDQTLLPDSKQAVTELQNLVKTCTGKEIVGSVYGTLSIDLRLQSQINELKGRQANLIQVSPEAGGQIAEFVQCRQIHLMFPDSFALQIDGDSMSPRINDGDIVILSPSVPASQGCIAVAKVANQIGVTCKLTRIADDAVHLIPINEKYQTKIVARKDLLWALAVLCHISV